MVQYIAPQRSLTPVLDISPWRDGSDKVGVAHRFDRICREIGFFYLVGHGVPQVQMDRALQEARRFFDMPDAYKRSLGVNAARRGYEPLGAQALDVESPPDIKESLLMGAPMADDHPLVRARLPNYGGNVWPDELSLPGFRSGCEAYRRAVSDLSETLMAIFAVAAGMDERYFADLLIDPMASLRFLHYPPQPARARDNQIGCGAHTDWGTFTILLQDDTGGLEVQAASGEWLLAEPMHGAFVVNLGDMMPVWTNGAYHSNAHRVLNRSPDGHRYSVPFFQDLNYYARIECLPKFRPQDGCPVIPARTAGEHFELMYRKTREAVVA
jgi:isopenicillin N synthase-like dioxygenase